MILQEIKENHIHPFEINNAKLVQLFSFFLHKAPTIGSEGALAIDDAQLQTNWTQFIEYLGNVNYGFISSNQRIENFFGRYDLDNTSTVSRKKKGFICKYKDSNEKDYECLLRHIRNAIAHEHVYLKTGGNRNYILFEDFSTNSGNQSSRIIFCQTDLAKLRTFISQK